MAELGDAIRPALTDRCPVSGLTHNMCNCPESLRLVLLEDAGGFDSVIDQFLADDPDADVWEFLDKVNSEMSEHDKRIYEMLQDDEGSVSQEFLLNLGLVLFAVVFVWLVVNGLSQCTPQPTGG